MESLHVLLGLFDTRLLLAAVLGLAIGLEREIWGKDPSLRTFTFICMGSCMFSILSQDSVAAFPMADPSRIAAQVVAGIGFFIAGTIVRSQRKVMGLTTGALIWIAAAIGMAAGFNKSHLAVGATLGALFISLTLNVVHDIIRRIRPEEEGVRTGE